MPSLDAGTKGESVAFASYGALSFDGIVGASVQRCEKPLKTFFVSTSSAT